MKVQLIEGQQLDSLINISLHPDLHDLWSIQALLSIQHASLEMQQLHQNSDNVESNSHQVLMSWKLCQGRSF